MEGKGREQRQEIFEWKLVDMTCHEVLFRIPGQLKIRYARNFLDARSFECI